MILTFVVAFLSLIGLLVLHEFGHFIIAKRFGVRVEEFGIGYPPRLFGKKIGETIFSINLLPFGAFVKVPGEIEKTDDPRSFSNQSLAKRSLIIVGGVLSFWVMAAIIFGIVFNLGVPTAVEDNDTSVISPKVQIISISPNSPAKVAGLFPGDTIKGFNKVKDLQNFIEQSRGKEITLTIERGKDILEIKTTPRVSPPTGEGSLGVGLARVALKTYPWYQTPWKGISQTFILTGAIIQGYYEAITKVFRGVPTGVQLTGPVGVFGLLNQASQLGAAYFMNFLGTIAIYLAIGNLFPIPAVDGGKLLFLGIEAIRRKPILPKVEQIITTIFFGLLILLMLWVTIGDVRRLF